MKHVLASLTVAVCLLLPSAGVVLAANPHTVTKTTGQPGTNNGITCNSTTTGGVVIGGGPGGSTSGNGSAFNTGTSTTPPFLPTPYAGNPGNPTNPTAPGGGVGNPAHAVAQYDVACFQQAP
jgi:hypothetical protein